MFLDLLPFLFLLPAQAQVPSGTRPHPILEGVREVAFPGIPSDIVIWNPKAKALIGAWWGQTKVPIAVALEAGKGRILVTGHACFGKGSLSQADSMRFFENSLRWLGHGRKKMEILYNTSRGKFPIPARLAWKATRLPRSLPKDLDPSTQILFLDPTRLTKGDTPSLRRFVEEGGGLYVFGVGWGYLQIHPGRDLLRDAAFNRILVPFGLAIGRGLVSAKAPARGRRRKARRRQPRFYPALSRQEARPLSLPGALSVLRQDKAPTPLSESAASTLLRCAGLLPRGNPPLSKLFDALAPLVQKPFSLRTRALLRLLQDKDPRLLAGAPGEDPKLFVPDFPGRMPKTPPVAIRRRINLATPGWISTGIYVPPGRIVSVQVLSQTGAALPALQVQVGAHSDRLWKKTKWKRDPELVKRFPLVGKAKVLSRYGGLLYLLPHGKGGVSPQGGAQVELRTYGGVAAPRFVLGETSVEDWQKMLKSPAPWGELEGRRIIFTMQTAKLRRLKDPRGALAFWDQVIDLYEKLDPQPRRARKQRVVFDRQISAGSLHSGYPIMGHLPHQDAVVRADNYVLQDGKRKGRFWGLLHELGHNYQQRAWTFGGTGEVTNNVFVLYANEKLLGAPIAETIQQRKLLRQKEAYLAKGAPFATWKSKPFLALMTYIELIQTYGWESLHKVYQDYRAHPLPRRASNSQKIQQYVLRWCRVTGKDLAPFFRSWGWPLDPSTIQACAAFPAPTRKHRKFE